MARTLDVVIELHGANSSTTLDDALSDHTSLRFTESRKAAYRARQAGKPLPRELLHVRQGVQHAVPAGQAVTVDAVAHSIRKVEDARKAGDLLGSVSIAGYSIGSWYVLVLADELFKRGIRTLIAATCDFPMFPFGFSDGAAPPPGCDRMMPSNEPDWLRLGDIKPPRASNFPRVNGPIIRGFESDGERLNFFQRGGNGLMPVSPFNKRTPSNTFWWWSSNMQNEEIHGELIGWTNREITVSAPQSNDDGFHNVGDEMGMQQAGDHIMARLML